MAQIQVGVLAGYNNSRMTHLGQRVERSSSDLSSSVEGKHFFLQLRTPSQKRARIVAEAGYTEHGMPYSDPGSFCFNFKELRLNYLSAGGHVEYGLLRLGKLRLDALCGLNTSYLASAYVTAVGSHDPWDIHFESKSSFRDRDHLRQFSIGVNTGSALSLNIGDTQIQARGTYYLGLRSISKSPGIKSKSLMLSLGVARTIR